MGANGSSSRTLLDLPDKLAEPLERNALAVRFRDRLADEPETVRDILEAICEWTGTDPPTLDEVPEDSASFRIVTGLTVRSAPPPTEDRVEFSHPLEDRFLGTYYLAATGHCHRLVEDLHALRRDWDTLQDRVQTYNARLAERARFPDAADLRAVPVEGGADDGTRERLLWGYGGLGQLLLWALSTVQQGTISRQAARAGRLRVRAPDDGSTRDRRSITHGFREDELRDMDVNIEHLKRSDWRVRSVAVDHADDAMRVTVRIDRRGDHADGGSR